LNDDDDDDDDDEKEEEKSKPLSVWQTLPQLATQLRELKAKFQMTALSRPSL